LLPWLIGASLFFIRALTADCSEVGSQR
jgi:hypothetical protein